MKYLSLLLIAILFFPAFYSNGQTSDLNVTVSINGTIISQLTDDTQNKVFSLNGKYSCSFNIDGVTDEYRELSNLRFYEGDNLLFTLLRVPGADVEISNSGYVLFYDHSKHFTGELKIYFYSKTGNHFLTKTFLRADQFVFSESGNSFGVSAVNNISVIHLPTAELILYENGICFDISRNDNLAAIVRQNGISIYNNGTFTKYIPLNLKFIRNVKISSVDNIVAVINKRNLIAYSLSDGSKIFSKQISGDLSYRDIKIIDGEIISGIHKKNSGESTGLLRVYNLSGNLMKESSGKSRLIKKHNKVFLPKQNNYNYDPIPWPFEPFDSMRTVWNHYEQHMGNGGGDWSYLHQGLDLIVPIAEETYAVADGFVKLVLTLGGSSYWRIAVSDTMVDGYSDGWLYAHLIENTIQFDVGDTVYVHDYLGDIIQWSSDWGHIHFVEIRDSGLVWFYNDNEWGINFNPLLALQPLDDITAPVIEPVFGYSKFGFCENETSNYLSPDSLYGFIDIIIKVVDYAGDSEWQQPAFRTYYWITNEATGDTIQTRKMGHILNHTYPFYASDWYVPYAEVMYKRDNILPASSWNDTERNYYHNLTNSNGDSLVDLNERLLAFNTANFADGFYRIFVEVFDEAGNSATDSMDVKFVNGNVVSVDDDNSFPNEFSLSQNYPNPFNPSTKIKYALSNRQYAILKVYDVLGNEVATLVNEEKPAGNYEVDFNGNSLTSGIYFYQLKAGPFIQTMKMILLR